MTTLLELREMMKKIYSKNAVFILPVVKFLVALIVLGVLNGRLGYMAKIDNVAILLIVSLACSFLPTGCVVLFGALFSLLHMYALSLEVAIVGFFLYLVILLLYLRFAPKDSLVIAVLPVLFVMKIPYVMPIVMGLVGGPMSAVSVACATVVYYILLAVTSNAAAVTALDSDAIGKVRLLVDGFLGNKAMIVMVVAFAITTVVVYIIRRLSIDYSWSIAMVTGAILILVILLVGDLIYDTNLSVIGMIFGSVLAVAIGKVVEFFRFCVDYGRTEKVQFEDDEYYYYVKAVPKMSVAESTKTVKRINSQRNVETERTRSGASSFDRRTVGRTVTVGNEFLDDEDVFEEETEEDFEDLF